jgi:hypothetical protein
MEFMEPFYGDDAKDVHGVWSLCYGYAASTQATADP